MIYAFSPEGIACLAAVLVTRPLLAFDIDGDGVERARQSLPAELAERIDYRVASGKEIEIERHAFEIALFSWSL